MEECIEEVIVKSIIDNVEIAVVWYNMLCIYMD